MPDRVLLVEDDLLTVSALRDALGSQGIHTETADTAQAALERFRSSSYDVVVVEIGLPDRNGLDLLADLRDMDPEAAFLVVSAQPSLQHARRAMRLGARDFLPKPLQAPDFLQTIRVTLQAIHQRRAAVRAREMDVANRMAVSLCNNFNNLLGGIIGRASLLRTQGALPASLGHEFDEIEREARRMADLVRRMSLFCQTHADTDMDVLPLELLNDTLRACRRRFGCEIEWDREPVQARMDCNAHRLATLLHEVVQFGCTLLPAGSLLKITTRIATSGLSPHLVIRVIPQQGIVPDLAPSSANTPPVLSWQSSTLESEGMTLARLIALQLEGTLRTVQISPEQSALELAFPVRRTRERKTELRPPEAFPLRGSVLIIDDTPTVLRLTGDMIRRLAGLPVHGAASGAPALELLRAPSQDVGLVLLDILLGEESGFDVYAEVRKVNRLLPVVFMSGYAGDARLSAILQQDPHAAFLPKPFDMNQLKDVLAGRVAFAVA